MLCCAVTNKIYSYKGSYLFFISILVAGLCKTNNSLRKLLLYFLVRLNILNLESSSQLREKNGVQMSNPKLYKESTNTGVSQENWMLQIECGKMLRASGHG